MEPKPEHIADLDSLKNLRNPPRLKRNPKTDKIEILNKEQCKDIEGLTKRVAELEKKHQRFVKTLNLMNAKLISQRKETRNLNHNLNNRSPAPNGTKAK